MTRSCWRYCRSGLSSTSLSQTLQSLTVHIHSCLAHSVCFYTYLTCTSAYRNHWNRHQNGVSDHPAAHPATRSILVCVRDQFKMVKQPLAKTRRNNNIYQTCRMYGRNIGYVQVRNGLYTHSPDHDYGRVQRKMRYKRMFI
jgi:hypothetical protein